LSQAPHRFAPLQAARDFALLYNVNIRENNDRRINLDIYNMEENLS
jgi:hypothetical protein